jgi:hypothetical protein
MPRTPVKFVRHLVLLLCLSALAGAMWVGHRPADLSGVAGIAPSSDDAKVRDIIDDLRIAAIKRSGLLEISEADLNRHLAAILSASVVQPAGQWVAFERLALDLEPATAHATLVWNVRGHRSTATVQFQVLRQENAFRIEVTGGSYGHLDVPRGMLRPLAPVLGALSRALEPEIDALFQMNQVEIVKDKLVLDPRFL